MYNERPMSMLQTAQETTTAGRVKGSIIRAHAQWVRDYFGDRVMARVLSVMPPAAAIEANGVVDPAWCSFETLMHLDHAILEVCGARDAQLARELGRYTAHLMLSAGARSFRPEDIHRFCRCSVVADALLQERGTLAYEEVSERHGRIIICGTLAVSPLFCLGVSGYYEQILTAHGSREVTVVESVCQARGQDACAFELRWA